MSPASATLRPIQLVCTAVGMGSLMITVVRIFIDPEAPMPSTPAIAIVLVALLAAAALISYAGYTMPSLPAGLARENAESTALHFFTSGTILRTALAEAPVLVAFAVSFAFTPRSWLPLAIAVPGALALFWLHAWPSARTAAATEQALEAGGAKSYLSEALGFRLG